MPPRRRPTAAKCPEDPTKCTNRQLDNLLKDQRLLAQVRRALQVERQRRDREERTQRRSTTRTAARASAPQPAPAPVPAPQPQAAPAPAPVVDYVDDYGNQVDDFFEGDGAPENFVINEVIANGDSHDRVLNALQRVKEYRNRINMGDRNALTLLAEITGMKGNRNITRPQYSHIEEAMEAIPVIPGETFFDRLRRFRTLYRERAGYRNTNLEIGYVSNLAYHDLIQRMALLRNSTISQTRTIPVYDYTVSGRITNEVESTDVLADAIVRALDRSRIHRVQMI